MDSDKSGNSVNAYLQRPIRSLSLRLSCLSIKSVNIYSLSF